MLANRNPDLYHGHNRNKNFFEGWYYKLVDAKKEHVIAIIPGIFYGSEPDHHHGFIQLVQAVGKKYNYFSFPANAFRAAKKSFQIDIDSNSFSLDSIRLNLDKEGVLLKGNLSFENITKWPDTCINPGSMGFYNYIPNMQCYAQVCAMDMDILGSIEINNEKIDFDGGKGYVEKNWGKMFPFSWIWIQSNQFSNYRASLSCSLAHIPLPFGSFRGFLIGLLLDKQFFSFTSMNRSKMRISSRGHDVSIRVENKDYIMKMDTETTDDDFILLNGPREGKMVPLVQENLTGRVGITLMSKTSNHIIFQSVGECAGIEYGGNQMLVLDENSKRGLDRLYE